MAKKKQPSKPVTEADLRFRHLDLAKRVSQHMLQEMIKEGLTPRDIPQVLNDICKYVVLLQANVSKGNALDVATQFVDLSTDITCLMVRVATENYGKGLESLKEETNEPHPREINNKDNG